MRPWDPAEFDPWTLTVMALWNLAAQRTERQGRTYNQWLRAVTRKATAMCEAAGSV